MIEISEAAGRLIDDAWRRGRILIIAAPWREYVFPPTFVALWRHADDEATLADHVRLASAGAIYLRRDLLGQVRRRRLRLERHSFAGIWPGIAVHELPPRLGPERWQPSQTAGGRSGA